MNARIAATCSGALFAAALLPSVSHAQSGFIRAGATNGSGVAPMQPPTTMPGAPATTPGAADVPWEERTVPYTGGPVPPGAQIDERTNSGMTGGGAAAILVGYLLPLIGIGDHPVAAVPIVGPLLVLGGVSVTPGTLDGGGVALMAVSEVLQLGGIALLTAGFFLPRRTLVYDAPVDAPRMGQLSSRESRRMRWALTPGAPGAPVGASLTVVNF